MIADDQFKFDHVTQDNVTYVNLHGVIDEDAKFESIAELEGPLVLNFKNVKSINSCGIRNWVNFMKTLGARDVYYSECPPLIVRQMNMVPSFLGAAKVMSVFVGYICDNCENEHFVSVTETEFAGGNPNIAEVLKCESCGEEEMELDGDPQQYFAFAR